MHAALMYYQHVRKSEESGAKPIDYNVWLITMYLECMH